MGKHHMVSVQENITLDELIDEMDSYMYDEYMSYNEGLPADFLRMSGALLDAKTRLEVRDMNRETILARQQGREPDYSQIVRRV